MSDLLKEGQCHLGLAWRRGVGRTRCAGHKSQGEELRFYSREGKGSDKF